MTAYYTHALWRVLPGHEGEFIRLWEHDLADAFQAVDPDATGVLIQSLDDPTHFYSFGPWRSLDAMARAREAPAVGRALDTLRSHCAESSPGAFRVVLEIRPKRPISER